MFASVKSSINRYYLLNKLLINYLASRLILIKVCYLLFNLLHYFKQN